VSNLRRRAFPRLPPNVERDKVSLEATTESKSVGLTIEVGGKVEKDGHGKDNTV